MATYVMSDIHGCYELLIKMLKEIHFTKEDHLIIAGDLVDRGPDTEKVLDFVMDSNNIECTIGNHDEDFIHYCNIFQYLEPIYQNSDMTLRELYRKMVTQPNSFKKYFHSSLVDRCYHEIQRYGYLIFDAYQTIQQLYDEKGLSLVELWKYRDYLMSLPVYKEISINSKKFVIAHAAIEQPFEQYPRHKAIWEREKFLFGEGVKGYTTIVGHTPTISSIVAQDGCIWHSRIDDTTEILDIDCGGVFAEHYNMGAMACVRLEDMKEYYVRP